MSREVWYGLNVYLPTHLHADILAPEMQESDQRRCQRVYHSQYDQLAVQRPIGNNGGSVRI